MSSTSLELQPLELLCGDLFGPLGAVEELCCFLERQFHLSPALSAQNTGHTTVERWRDKTQFPGCGVPRSENTIFLQGGTKCPYM